MEAAVNQTGVEGEEAAVEFGGILTVCIASQHVAEKRVIT